MNKLSVGMHIRTKWGYICKLVNINDYREPKMKYGVEANCLKYIMFIGKGDIKDASFDIMDLIEVGDYVNGCRVHKIGNCLTIILDNEENISWINPNDIKTIVTREQFESMSYRIGE